MSDRFYMQMVEKTGWAPGYRNTTTIEEYRAKFGSTKRRKNVAWTDEKKQEAVDMYTAEEPTPENSMEIVKDIAEEHEESPNGVRMILTKAGVYVKKAPASGGSKASASGGSSGGRVSKAAAIESLSAAISDAGQEVDQEILDKLTGKAAVYFAAVIAAIASN